MSRSSRTSTLGLLGRYRAHVRAGSLALSLLVLAASVLALVVPSAFSTTGTREIRQSLEQAAPTDRYLIATSHTTPGTGSSSGQPAPGYDETSDRLFGAFRERLGGIRAQFPPLLRASTGAPRWSLTTSAVELAKHDPRTRPPGGGVRLALRIDPLAQREVRVVDGTWPGSNGSTGSVPGAHGRPVQIALSQQQASAVGWTVGQVRSGYVLSATFRARSARSDYWSLNDSMLEPNVLDDGNNAPVYTATAFADPVPFELGPDPVESSGITLTVWYPLDLTAVPGSGLDDVIAQVRKVTATPWSESPDTEFMLTSAGLSVLEAAQSRVQAARSVLTIAGVGPAAAVLAVLLLGIRVFGLRRRTTLGLLVHRGTPRLRLRALLALEGLLVGVPPVLVALLGCSLLSGTAPSPAGIGAAVVVALLPALLLSLVPLDQTMRESRADVGVRRASPYRAVLEVAVLVLAAASARLFLAAGAGRAGGGVDALAVAAPLLLSVAACLLVLRLYPLPLRLVARRLRRSGSTVGYLGALRALRDPAVTVAPVFSVLVGISVATLSVIVVSTVSSGTQQAALGQVGAPLRVDGPVLTDQVYARVRALDGVAAAARLDSSGSVQVRATGHAPTDAGLFLTDLAALRRVQRDVPGTLLVPRRQGVVVSRGLAGRGEQVGLGARDPVSVPVLATAATAAGVTSGDQWVLADAAQQGVGVFAPRTLLVSLTPDADVGGVSRRLAELTGGRVTSAARAAETVSSDAVTRNLRGLLVAAVATVGLAALGAVVLSLALGARARARQLAVLRVLGVPARQRGWLAVWEQAPGALVAMVVGVGLGLVLAAMVHGVVDLTPFTGGQAAPGLAVRWWGLAGLLGGFALVVAVAIGMGQWLAGRTSPARAVRLDEE